MSDPRSRFLGHRVERSHRNPTSVADMLDAIEVGLEIRQRGYAHFMADSGQADRFAAYYVVIRIAEASARLTQEFRETHSHIPWRDIDRMRTRLTHVYPDIDDDAVWQVLERDLPRLQDELRSLEALD